MDAQRPHRVAVLPVVVAVVLALGALASAVPQRAVSSPAVDRAASAVAQVLPQGWSFFTKPPQTARYRLWGAGDEGLVDVVAHYAVDGSSAFGLGRGYRNMAAERETVERRLAGERLESCPAGVLEECARALGGGEPSFVMSTSVREPHFCGPFVVAVDEPVPWAWRHLVERNVRTTHVTTLEITCPAR